MITNSLERYTSFITPAVHLFFCPSPWTILDKIADCPRPIAEML